MTSKPKRRRMNSEMQQPRDSPFTWTPLHRNSSTSRHAPPPATSQSSPPQQPNPFLQALPSPPQYIPHPPPVPPPQAPVFGSPPPSYPLPYIFHPNPIEMIDLSLPTPPPDIWPSTSSQPDVNTPRPRSPTPSVRPITPEAREAAFVEDHGRRLSSRSQVYQIPCDDEEISRLDIQHALFLLLRNGKNYVGPIPEVLRRESGSKQVLDLGCGTGAWCRDMGREFPHCEIVGVDLVPIQLESALPDNVRIEVDDINLGLPHFYDQFDLVHTRLISSGITDYEHLVDEISKILRPGGMVLLQDYDFKIYNHNKDHMPPVPLGTPGHAWLPHFMQTVCSAMQGRGGSVGAASMFYQWLNEHPDFEAVEGEDLWLPVGQWFRPPRTRDEVMMNHIGDITKKDMMTYVRGARPLLIKSGLDEPAVDEFIQNTLTEMMSAPENGLGVGMCNRVYCVWARKRASVPTPRSRSASEQGGLMEGLRMGTA